MANVNKPAGLSPVKHLITGPYNGQANIYHIASGNGSAFAIGDPVKTDTGNADANGVSPIALATAGDGNAIRGVIIALGRYENLLADPSNLDTMIVPATKTHDYYALVIDDPYVVFEVQEFSGGGSTNFTAADIGKNCNLKAGTNNGYISSWVLDDTAVSAVTSTRQVRLLGISRRIDNVFGNYCKFLVQINNHELKAAVAGV